MPADLSAHPNWDIGYDCCADCGASHTEIDDNLVKVCEPIYGPHKLALFEIKRQAMSAAALAEMHRKMGDRKQLPFHLAMSRDLEVRAAAFKASFDALKALDGEPPERVRQDAALIKAIRR
jgi:hypothetical protein